MSDAVSAYSFWQKLLQAPKGLAPFCAQKPPCSGWAEILLLTSQATSYLSPARNQVGFFASKVLRTQFPGHVVTEWDSKDKAEGNSPSACVFICI